MPWYYRKNIMSAPKDIEGPFQSDTEAWEAMGSHCLDNTPGPLSQVFFKHLSGGATPEKANVSNDLSYATYPAEVIPRKR